MLLDQILVMFRLPRSVKSAERGNDGMHVRLVALVNSVCNDGIRMRFVALPKSVVPGMLV
jgi:hypothetical protein